MEQSFSSPFMLWEGIDLPGVDEDGLVECNRYYDDAHLPETVERNPGFTQGHRYELNSPGRWADSGPSWLAIYEIADAQSAQAFLKRQEGQPEIRPKFASAPPAWRAHAQTRWQMLWRRISQSSDPIGAADSISVVGMNPPEDSREQDIAEFNDYYTNVHVPEFLQVGGFARGTRYEIMSEMAHPAPGCPRFLAVYEKFSEPDEDTAPPRSLASDDLYTPGPDAWNRHVTSWILRFQRHR